MNESSIVLNGRSLSIDDVYRVAKDRVKVEISSESLELLETTRKLVFELSNSEEEIYGLTTGVGANKDNKILPEYFSTFNRNLILAHCVGIKPEASEEVVRAAMVVRLNTLLLGATGIQPKIAMMYKDFLNYEIHPVMPERGSVGTADVTTLSYIGLAMMGEGEVHYKGSRMKADKALELTGLEKIVFGPKDGLSIVSSNALSGGMGALVFKEIKDLLDMADVVYAMSLEAININTMFINPKSNELRPLSGQIYSNNKILDYLDGSYIWDNDNRSLHGSMVFKAGWAIHGSVRDALEYTEKYLSVQLNSSDDCPYVLLDDKDIISTANFIVMSLAVGFEMLGVALSHLSKTICNRVLKLSQPKYTGLPRFLRPRDDVIAFSTMQKSFTSLDTEIRHMANPATLDYFATSNETEDHGSNTPYVIRKINKIVDDLRYIIGIEMMHAAQGIDLRKGMKLGKGTKIAYETVRKEITFLDEDRDLSVDIEKAYNIIKSGILLKHIKEVKYGGKNDRHF
ncbi:aromatic amino acid ammonia-lyase [Wukongibacter baidiensis]|uniref:HAL/PAL/TAL family ammonia-lyase n=1 Tax=Wukongibacter baidiensis TaxID=1723361 RepID=UPI003D7F8B6B